MKFVIFLAGISLILIGTLAYTTITNQHQTVTDFKQNLTGALNIPVGPGSESETPENVTLVPGRITKLVVNLTVSLESGTLSSVQFKIFTAQNFGTCMQQADANGCLVDMTVSNQTVVVPLNSSLAHANGATTLYFGFTNREANSKTVALSATLQASKVEITSARDGNMNLAALGIAGIGLLLTLYGVAAKAVIPWE